jgi:alpha-D-ribose 1-methylphosphonate 5-phosphate C-P lyase
VSLDFEDHPFDPSKAPHPCALCGAEDSYLDEVITDDARAGGCSSVPTPITARSAAQAAGGAAA